MALDRAIDSAQLDENLTAVADAIRAKGGTSGTLAFPDGFVEAVGAIQAGGGDDHAIEDLFVTRASRTEEYVNDRVSSIGVSAFQSYSNMKCAMSFPNATSVGGTAFYGCGCTSLSLPKNNSNNGMAFRGMYNCTYLDLGSAGSISNYFIEGCNKLETLILRKTSLVTLGGTAASDIPTSCPIRTGTGRIYVPAALVESYKTATNWTVIYEENPDVFQPLEGSEYE